MSGEKRSIGIVMGSDSDWPIMQAAADICTRFELAYETKILSAHRTPDDMSDYARHAHKRGLQVIIAGAGGAAHLPGMIASLTPLPVIGVPIAGKVLQGMDALLSIVQMPPGVPVATVAIGGGQNAGILAAMIIASSNPKLQQGIIQFKKEMAAQSTEKNKRLRQQNGWLLPDETDNA